MRIGILTGGGDVPGLNACIKAVTMRVAEAGDQVFDPRAVQVRPQDHARAMIRPVQLAPDNVDAVRRISAQTVAPTSSPSPK